MTPEPIIQADDWVNHGSGEEDFDPEMVAWAKQEELKMFLETEGARGCCHGLQTLPHGDQDRHKLVITSKVTKTMPTSKVHE